PTRPGWSPRPEPVHRQADGRDRPPGVGGARRTAAVPRRGERRSSLQAHDAARAGGQHGNPWARGTGRRQDREVLMADPAAEADPAAAGETAADAETAAGVAAAEAAARSARALRYLYLFRTGFSAFWVALVFSLASAPAADGRLGWLAASLLVVYPVSDAVATLADIRSGRIAAGLVQWLNLAADVAAAVAVLVAVQYGLAAAITVFGAWAVVSGAVMIYLAIRRRPPWMSLLDRDEVPDPKSRASTSPTDSPLVAASRATPAPTTPPPTTSTWCSMRAIAARARSRSAGPSRVFLVSAVTSCTLRRPGAIGRPHSE